MFFKQKSIKRGNNPKGKRVQTKTIANGFRL